MNNSRRTTMRMISESDVRNSDDKNYNEAVWNERITSLAKYDDVLWFVAEAGGGYDYDRYFVEYTLPEGLRLFSDFGYSSSLSSRGFSMLTRDPMLEDGRTFFDVIRLGEMNEIEAGRELMNALEHATLFSVGTRRFRGSDGDECCYNNTPAARREMIEKSRGGLVFTKEGL
jgi:hypothetical protein